MCTINDFPLKIALLHHVLPLKTAGIYRHN